MHMGGHVETVNVYSIALEIPHLSSVGRVEVIQKRSLLFCNSL